MQDYYVYILASVSRALYVGVTNNLEVRVWQHKHPERNSFASRYRINRLVYLDRFQSVSDAIAAEKRIKGWTRARKIALIDGENPDWRDLSEGWYHD